MMHFSVVCSLVALAAPFGAGGALQPSSIGQAGVVPPAGPSSVAPPSRCPLRNCWAQGGGAEEEGSEGQEPYESQTPCDEELSNYSVAFAPGHFVCMKCDASACPGCSILCDLASCVGTFYTQECWCETGDDKGLEPTVVFCDEDCGGGVCDTPGFQCGSRYTACQPWWACGAPPPRSFLQRRSDSRRASSKQGRASTLSRRLGEWRAKRAKAKAESAAASRSLPEELHFRDGRFECETAGLPPKTRDPQSLVWVERGYLVLDRKTCQGSAFDHECFCWDNFRRLQGEDPLTSELMCDSKCKWGGCEGKTCSKELPGPLLGPPAVRHPEQTRIDGTMAVVMEAVDSPGFKPGPRPMR